ncbi:MAG: VCBS repeat-containing protein [Haliscomenobacter sp.]|nr:VCBS repeat-containing protein [Haliscomenobacter sp.]MBK9492280.1 VCBS repeat-containing protein [Haliscomenobacter sp.]
MMKSWDTPCLPTLLRKRALPLKDLGWGINICDINRDGWKDIYVTNDYLSNDLFWINSPMPGDQATGRRFVDKAASYLKHTCYSAMGNNVADLNNDGLADIVALDMQPEDNFRRKTMLPPNNYTAYFNNDRFGYQYQYIRNTLQLNQGIRPDNGEPLFSEISMFSGISSTDWSWTPLIADFDNNGYRDIIVSNGFP